MKIVKITLLSILGIFVLFVAAVYGFLQFYLPHVGPVPQITVASTPETISRGDYLVNHVTGCLDCHSGHDDSKFSSPIARGTEGKGGEVFGHEDHVPGTLTAKNITPYHLKNWTDGELFRTLTTGVNKDGQPLFPLMPYPHFNQMDPEDIQAIIAYIRTLNPITNDPPASKLDPPMNWIVRTIPMKYQPEKRPTMSDSVSYGKYMVNAASCTDCHTPMDDHGQYIETKSFAGGVEFPVPSGGKCHTANITPAVAASPPVPLPSRCALKGGGAWFVGLPV